MECERRYHFNDVNLRIACAPFRLRAIDCFGKVLCPMQSDLLDVACNKVVTGSCTKAIKDYNSCLFFNNVPPFIDPFEYFDEHTVNLIHAGFMAKLRSEKAEIDMEKTPGNIVSRKQQ